jgi:site-specific DNA-methyltransferase (adenine-specific)
MVMAVTLIHGDCLDVLKTLDSGSVDAVITDPPYGINYSPSQNTAKAWGNKTFVGSTVVANDDKPFDPEPFLRFPTVVLFGANNYADRLPASRGWIVWDKREHIASNDFADCELIWTNIDGVARIFRHYWSGALRASEQGESRVHPTQKPLALMQWLVCNYTKPGELVFDPFMGSGTTGVACVKTGRNFIGIELDEGYYKIAERRIAEAQMQLPLLEAV